MIEALRYGVWAGLLLLIAGGFIIGLKFGKKDKRFWIASVGLWAFAVYIYLSEIFGT
jgi:hypothetical protein